MTMPSQSDLITRLTEGLEPVRPLRARTGLVLVGAAALSTALLVMLLMGIAANVNSGHVSSHLLIVNGLLLVLGVSASASVVAMASPSVGSRYDGPKWAMGMTAILPLAAILLMLGKPDFAGLLDPYHGLRCAAVGILASTLVAGTLVVWLRRGAPVSLTRAGLYTGVAAGALGSVSYGLSCPLDSIYHLGIWHFLPVAACATLGGIAVPRLVRW
jgi:hypothetical protein